MSSFEDTATELIDRLPLAPFDGLWSLDDVHDDDGETLGILFELRGTFEYSDLRVTHVVSIQQLEMAIFDIVTLTGDAMVAEYNKLHNQAMARSWGYFR